MTRVPLPAAKTGLFLKRYQVLETKFSRVQTSWVSRSYMTLTSCTDTVKPLSLQLKKVSIRRLNCWSLPRLEYTFFPYSLYMNATNEIKNLTVGDNLVVTNYTLPSAGLRELISILCKCWLGPEGHRQFTKRSLRPCKWYPSLKSTYYDNGIMPQ